MNQRDCVRHDRLRSGSLPRTRRAGRSWKRMVAVVAPVLLVAGLIVATPGAQGAPASSGTSRATAMKVNFADPDMIRANGDFFGYATTAKNPAGCRYTGRRHDKKYLVPVIRTNGDTGVPSLGACPTGDALKKPSDQLVDRGSGIWAPSVVQKNDKKFFMYYSATRAGTKQKCIFRATASRPMGPFANSREFACPPQGRWAIDPDAYKANDGTLYLAYRDDAPVKFPQTALSAVKLDQNGFANWDSRVTLATSKGISWDTRFKTGGTSVIENPSIVQYKGRFLVTYSGNDWKSANYSTGLLDCGANLLGGSKCVQLSRPDRPYFGHRGTGMNPRHVLPGNPKGPGGLSMFKNNAGKVFVIYHYLDNLPKSTSRKSAIGELHYEPAKGAASITAPGGR